MRVFTNNYGQPDRQMDGRTALWMEGAFPRVKYPVTESRESREGRWGRG